MKKLVLMIAVCAAYGLHAFAQEAAKVSNKLTSNAADVRQQSFDIVWRTVKEKHFDPTFGGLDWDAVRRKYEPRVARIKKDAELYSLLNEMLGELRQSHFGVSPPEAILDDGSLNLPGGSIRMDLRIVGSQLIITRVAPDSTAARAGLLPGFVIKRIDGAETAKMLKEFVARMKKNPLVRGWSPGLKDFLAAQMMLYRAGGEPGTTARLQFLDERGQIRETAIEREKPSGELSPRFGYLPAQRTEFEAKRLASGHGYIRFNAFMMPVAEKVRAALREFKDAPGIVFDLRGNGGGIGGLAPGIVGLMETRQTSLGASRMRSGQMKLAVFPQSQPYTGPVAVLIDGGSGSTTEIFAAGLQELRRAVIVGERSAGAVLPSDMIKLPTGAIFQYAFADFRTPGGALIEGRGVAPDVEVKHTRVSLLAGRDAPLEAAIAELQKSPRREQ
jgi:carboxyl-terminal processing protease